MVYDTCTNIVVPTTKKIFDNLEIIAPLMESLKDLHFKGSRYLDTNRDEVIMVLNKLYNIISLNEILTLLEGYNFTYSLLNNLTSITNIPSNSTINHSTVAKYSSALLNSEILLNNNYFNNIEIERIIASSYTVDKTKFSYYTDEVNMKVINGIVYVLIDSSNIKDFLFINYITEAKYTDEIKMIFKFYLNIVVKNNTKSTCREKYTEVMVKFNNIFLTIGANKPLVS